MSGPHCSLQLVEAPAGKCGGAVLGLIEPAPSQLNCNDSYRPGLRRLTTVRVGHSRIVASFEIGIFRHYITCTQLRGVSLADASFVPISGRS